MTRYTDADLERDTTAAQVDAVGVLVTLLRPAAPVADGEGGFLPGTGDPVPQAPRRRIITPVRLVFRNGHNPEETTADGERYLTRYVMVGEYDDDVREGDLLTFRGEPLRVAEIKGDRTTQVVARLAGWEDGS